MNYLFDEIVARVRVALDENQVENAVVESDDTLELDDIISQKVLMAARQVLLTAPLPLVSIDCISRMPSDGWVQVTIGGRVALVSALPDDWLRLSSARVSDWHRAVSVAVGETDEITLTVFSDFDGIAPSAERPLVVIGEDSSGQMELRLHGGSGGTVSVSYVALPSIENGIIRLPERLEDAVVYLAAAMTASAIEDNRAGILYQLSDKAMGISTGTEAQGEGQPSRPEYYNRDGRKKRR